MHYRKDIQILRGISVILVVLFHLQFSGMNSGFLGVDVFFVISGFLMAVLYNPHEKGKFFYRRAKRLLPVYFMIILLTLIAAFIITNPYEYNQVQEQSSFALLFMSNIGFWLQNSYFSKHEFNPLLHLWSLGVEIQFYLLLPILYWFFQKAKIFFTLLLLMSLLACFIILGISPKTSFFILPFRLWEFLIGFGVATYFTNHGNVKNNNLGWIGMIALLSLVFIPLFDVEEEAQSFITGHPGIYALLVSISTGIVLAIGLPRKIETSKIGTALELIGKYSYSIYLVHFPIIILFLYQPFSGSILETTSLSQTLLLVILISIFSILFYRLIENPIQHSKNIFNFLFMMIAAIVVILLFGNNIQQAKYSDEKMKIFNALEDRSSYRCGKLFRITNPTAIACKITNTEEPVEKIFLIGNSHADSIKTTFTSVANNSNASVYFTVANDPMMTGSKIQAEDIIQFSLEMDIENIVMHYKVDYEKIAIRELVELASKNNIAVSFIMPVPIWDVHIPKAKLNYIEYNETLPIQTQKDYQNKNKEFHQELLTMKNISIYRVDNILCDPLCKFQDEKGNLFYFDDDHLTITGSKTLEGLFKKVFSDIKKGTKRL